MRRRRDTADNLLLARRFVASGCLDRLCWRGLCFRIFLTCRDSLVLAGSWFWHFLAFLASGAVLSRGREASESASRKAADEAAEASKIGPRRVENRAPRRPTKILEASGDLLGGSWAPDGRQDRSGSAPGRLLGRSWRLLGRSWRLFGPSWPCQEVPGRPREAPGKGPGRPFWCFFGWSNGRS